mgnify:CR=1 FL=1
MLAPRLLSSFEILDLLFLVRHGRPHSFRLDLGPQAVLAFSMFTLRPSLGRLSAESLTLFRAPSYPFSRFFTHHLTHCQIGRGPRHHWWSATAVPLVRSRRLSVAVLFAQFRCGPLPHWWSSAAGTLVPSRRLSVAALAAPHRCGSLPHWWSSAAGTLVPLRPLSAAVLAALSSHVYPHWMLHSSVLFQQIEVDYFLSQWSLGYQVRDIRVLLQHQLGSAPLSL